jgi:cytochrome c oxidase subunit 2
MKELTEKLLGLPSLASEHGQGVNDLIVYLHWLMAVLFVGWLCYFGYVLWRFRARKGSRGDYLGVQNHASSYVEFTVAGIEAALLIFVAVPLWSQRVDKFPTEAESTVVQVVAQQFAWNVRQAGRDGLLGRQDIKAVSDINPFGVSPDDKNGKDDIQVLNELHVPANKPVIAYVSSKDVIHSFKIPGMRVTQDAIPGMRIPVWFKPVKEGRYQIYCAQLCGNGHAAMAQGVLIVESPEAYQKWVNSKSAGSVSFE